MHLHWTRGLTNAFKKQSSFVFFCNSFRFQPGVSETSVQTHLPFQYFLSLKNVPHVPASTKHLNIQSQQYGTTHMKHGSQTHFLKHTTQDPWSNTSSGGLKARNWGLDQVRECICCRRQRGRFLTVWLFGKVGDMNDRSKSTWQAKIQFPCIDRYSGKIIGELF